MTSLETRLQAGAVVAGFRVDALLGEGGMGVVYRATSLRDQQTVALKVLKTSFAADPQYRTRFERESRAAASIRHPHVVTVYSTGEEKGMLYLAMRLIEGTDLESVLRAEGTLAPDRAVRLIAEVASALDAAHLHGLVHRDVKPSNVLIDHEDHAYLTDFGLAIFGLDAERKVTAPGQAVGSIDYMAPEQIRGESLDGRADIYGLGCVLFECLTGRAPFSGMQGMRVLWAHMTEVPEAPTSLRPGLQVAFDAVIARALAKDPGERYPTATALSDDARLALSSPLMVTLSASAPAPEPSRICPACGRENEAGRDFCSCGEYLRWTQTSSHDVAALGASPPAAPPALPAYAPSPTGDADDQPSAVILPDSRPRSSWWAPGPPAPPPPAPEPALEPDGGPSGPGQPRARRAESGAVRLRLDPAFRYVHQPLDLETGALPLLGNEDVAAALVERIQYSSGGSFLITGFRGVGKTTVIAHALRRLADGQEGSHPAVLPVFLNVARPRSTEELLFEVIRRLFEAMVDEGVLSRLDPDVQRKLILAYTRTSLAFKESRSSATERGRSVGVGLPIPMLSSMSPKLDLSSKTTDSLATEASFLAYSDADVEHDFLRIVSLFRRGSPGSPADPRRSGLRRVLRRPPAPQTSRALWRGKVIVVIDELDKLTEREDGLACIESLLSGLKNLLNTTGVHFLFVAGPDLGDIAQRNSHRGNSVYDSVFGWQLYVPCLWQATDHLLDAMVEEEPGAVPQADSFREYLKFKARGVPRLLLMELNSFVEWTDRGPCLALRPEDILRIEFYAGLQRMLEAFLRDSRVTTPFGVPIDEDRRRLGTYYVADAILRSGGALFTVADVVQSEGNLSVDPLLLLSSAAVEALLEHFVRNEILERVRGGGAEETFFGDAPETRAPIYRVTDDVEGKLAGFARGSERERAELAGLPTILAADAAQPAPAPGEGRLVASRYEVEREIARGGMGVIYRAVDRVMNRIVALKMLDVPTLLADDMVRGRFVRKASVAVGLEHPNIATTYDVFTDESKRPGVAMQFVEGTSLAQLTKKSTMEPGDAVEIGAALLDALGYLEERGLARLDLKPSSIVVDRELRPIIVDLGMAKHVGEPDARYAATAVGIIVGTPAYAAPEQLKGEAVDIRTDMYALALILCELISGKPVRAGMGLAEILAAQTRDVDLGGLPVSDALLAVLSRALAADPDQRYRSPAEMQAALFAGPEARPSAGPDQADLCSLLFAVPGAEGPPDAHITVSTEPGATIVIHGSIQNRSDIAEAYDLLLTGLPPGWATITPATTHLLPSAQDGSQAHVEATITLPRSITYPTTWTLDVSVASRTFERIATQASVTLHVRAPAPAGDVPLTPERIEG